MNKRYTVADLVEAKRSGRKIVAVSCYDYTTARLVAEAGADVILVGDSAAQMLLGFDSTLPASMDFMALMTAAVRRALRTCALWQTCHSFPIRWAVTRRFGTQAGSSWSLEPR